MHTSRLEILAPTWTQEDRQAKSSPKHTEPKRHRQLWDAGSQGGNEATGSSLLDRARSSLASFQMHWTRVLLLSSVPVILALRLLHASRIERQSPPCAPITRISSRFLVLSGALRWPFLLLLQLAETETKRHVLENVPPARDTCAQMFR